MEVNLIVAVSKKNNAIGANNELLWHLPSDMKYFKETTTGFPIITGRKNYESIPEKYRPLPNRENIVITRNSNYPANGAFIANSLEDSIVLAKSFNKSKCFIIGGGQIYKEALEKQIVDTMHISWIEGDFIGDTFFPSFEHNKWEICPIFKQEVDVKNLHRFSVLKYNAKFIK